MKTAVTVLVTTLLTAVAFLFLQDIGIITAPQDAVYMYDESNTKYDTFSSSGASCAISQIGKSCMTPWGAYIAHAETVISFSSGTQENGECIPFVSLCNNGERYQGRKPKEFPSCIGGSSQSGEDTSTQHCLINGILLQNGKTYTMYKKNNDGTYSSTERYCNNGKLEGDDQYKDISTIDSCPQIKETLGQDKYTGIVNKPTKTTITKKPSGPRYNRCRAPDGSIRDHGKGGTYYLQDRVSYGQSCTETYIVCGYGSLRKGSVDGEIFSGPLYTSCEVSPPQACESVCGITQHGSSLITYSKSLIAHGAGIVCDDIKITSVCSNGKRDTAPGSACTCDIAPPSGCTAPNGQKVAHMDSLTLYQYPEVQALPGDGTDTCIRQRRQCINGTWHDYNGNPASFTFQYPTCTIIAPPKGGGPGGEGIPKE